MQIEIPTAPQAPQRVWDLYVPIVATKNVTHVYLTETIDTPALYNELCYALDTATMNETFHIYINTPGGMIDSAFMIIDAMRRTKAHIVGHLAGTIASAGTLVAMACNEITVAPYTAFMIHNYSMGAQGKGHELKSRQEFTDRSLNAAFAGIYEGFLTPQEMTQIIDGRDLWLSSDEVYERWLNKTKAKGAPKKGK